MVYLDAAPDMQLPVTMIVAAAETQSAVQGSRMPDMGVCFVVANVPERMIKDESGTYPDQLSISPHSDVSAYFRKFENRIIGNWVGNAGPNDTSSSTVIRQPEHGRLIEQVCPEGMGWCAHKRYLYVPDAGFVGQDSAIIEGEVNGNKVRLHYYIHSLNTDYYEVTQVCSDTGYRWKLSSTLGSMTGQLAAALPPLLGAAAQGKGVRVL